MSILHLSAPGAIADNYFVFLDNALQRGDQKLISYSKNNFNLNLKRIKIINNSNKLQNIFNLISNAYKSDKIIVHGFFGVNLLILFALNPWLLKRCYWVIWGGDLYYTAFRDKSLKTYLLEMLRKFTFKRVGHFVTHVKGDYELAKKWYGSTGIWHECFLYTSNLYKEYCIKEVSKKTVSIQVGNSADPSNNHLEVLDKLKEFRDLDILIYVPLSYGNQQYAKTVVEYGEAIYGNKLIALTEFVSFNTYLEILANIDIAIFNHKRQQALGNITTLLGLGKKVYLRSDVTSWALYESMNIKIFDMHTINLNKISLPDAKKNQEIIKSYFSEVNLIKQWNEVLEG